MGIDKQRNKFQTKAYILERIARLTCRYGPDIMHYPHM